MTHVVHNGWLQAVVLSQTDAPAIPQASGTTAPPPAQAVGVPGAPATSTPSGTLGTPPATPPPSPMGGGIIYIGIAMVAVMMVTSLLAGRKDKRKRLELMSTLKKHDKVQMLGGIIGTVAEVGDDDVVVRVEEGRIRFNKSAVQTIVTSSKARGESSMAELKDDVRATSV